MPTVPPQIRPEFDLDGVRIDLDVATGAPLWTRDWRAIFAFLLPAIAMIGAGVFQPTPWLGLLGVLLVFASGYAAEWLQTFTKRTVVLEIERGRVHTEQGKNRVTIHLSDVVDARWDCTKPTTRLVLVQADGSEQTVLHVLRRGSRTPGITRKQREWVLELLATQLDDATRADVPVALKNAVRGAREA